jgi:hypothetical protein
MVTLALAACGGSHKATLSPRDFFVPQKHLQAAGALVVTVPPGFRRYGIGGGIYRTGTSPPTIGVAVADYRLKAGMRSAFFEWSRLSSKGRPRNRVALALSLWEGLGVTPSANLHLPLSLDQPWFQEHLRNGVRGYRWGFVTYRKALYQVFFWSGRAAPPNDRSVVLDALTSIRPAP